MGKPLSDAQRDALLRLVRCWALGQPQPWDAIRPQTREGLRRAGLADGGITPRGLAALGFLGPAVTEWAKELRRAAETRARFRARLREWWAQVPVARGYDGATPLLSVADLRAAVEALGPYEQTAEEAERQAVWVEPRAHAEVRAAMGGDVADG